MHEGETNYDSPGRRSAGLILVCAFSLAVWITSLYAVTQLF